MFRTSKTTARTFVYACIAALLLGGIVLRACHAQPASAATLAGVCRATRGFMVRNQCRWPLRISQVTTRKACKSVGGTFVLAAKYQGCSR